MTAPFSERLASPEPPPAAVFDAFERATRAAEASRGATAPNPPVGCAILDRDGHVLAAAAHERAGEPHAEAAALATCRRDGTTERIHTIVATLEPCNHFGRTPPCSGAILGTPAKAVWIGARDPNPRVAGGGAERLADAGLVVHFLAETPGEAARCGAGRCRDLIAPFAKHALTGRPWVTVKQALDAGGSMIPPAGAKTFTSPAALAFAHGLRRRADAILTGSGTVLADAPEFTVRRVPDHPGKRRQLVVLDRRGRVPGAYVEAARRRNFDVVVARDGLAAALDDLGRAGVLEVLIEAGPMVTRSVIKEELWDEHVVIRKNPGADRPDQVEIRARSDGTVRRMNLSRATDGQGGDAPASFYEAVR